MPKNIRKDKVRIDYSSKGYLDDIAIEGKDGSMFRMEIMKHEAHGDEETLLWVCFYPHRKHDGYRFWIKAKDFEFWFEDTSKR